MVCAVSRRMLEQMGFQVLTAFDGREALKSFRAHTDEIVCVLLDLTMPPPRWCRGFQGDATYSTRRSYHPLQWLQ